MNFLRFFSSLCFLLCLVYAQTQTIVDQAGNSVVVVATTDPAGIPLTQTIETLPADGEITTTTNTPATTNTPTTTQTPAGPGPVGQPAVTTETPFGPTPFTYTTVVDGVTTAVADAFTPTNPATVPYTPTGTGTVWDYSQWLSSYGGSQATAVAAGRNAGHQLRAADGAVMIMITTCLLPIVHLL